MACAPGATASEISSRCRAMASLLPEGSTSPAPFPSAGQMAPKISAELVLWSCGAEGRVPRFAHRWVTLFFCPIRASSLHEGSFVNSYYCLIDGSPCRSLSRRLGGRGRLLNSERCITLHTVRVCDPATRMPHARGVDPG